LISDIEEKESKYECVEPKFVNNFNFKLILLCFLYQILYKNNVNIFLFGKLLRPEMIYFDLFLLQRITPVYLKSGKTLIFKIQTKKSFFLTLFFGFFSFHFNLM